MVWGPLILFVVREGILITDIELLQENAEDEQILDETELLQLNELLHDFENDERQITFHY